MQLTCLHLDVVEIASQGRKLVSVEEGRDELVVDLEGSQEFELEPVA
jgi:hypothetical protein